jgi:ATP-dependent DNA helicase RecG
MKINELELLVKEGEGLTVEFKERFTNKIDKDIVAFANSKGGYLILGVDDDGKIIGEKLTNKLKAAIVDLARKCDPSIPVKKISQVNETIVIEIAESDEKPHGCSHGFYRRLDAVTQKMTQKEIKLLFEENNFKSGFEERINKDATLDDISIDKIKNYFNEANIAIDKFSINDILTSLKLLKNGTIKNAAILFFAKHPRDIIMQCQMTCVAFKGTKGVHIYDRIDIQDDLLSQFNGAMTFLQKHLNVRSEIEEINRKDIYEIPLNALRESVANAIMHRNYDLRGTSIMVEVHEDRVEIVNPGGIPPGVDIKSLMRVSMRRNELIADLFARIDKAERIGSGLRRIGEIMDAANLPHPKIESNLFFRIIFERPFYTKPKKQDTPQTSEKISDVILTEIRKNPKISARELSEILGISSRAVEKHISKLKAEGILERIGHERTGYWKIIG